MRTFRWALVSGLVACGSGAVATAPDGDPDAARPPGAVPDGAAPANGVGDGGVDAADAADAAPRPIANGSSLSFDGVDDLLSLETVITTGKPENVTLTTPMTIEMWVKPDADASFPEVVFESSSAGVAVNLSVQLTPVVQCSTNGAHINIVAGTTNVADGQWHHIACTSDGKTARVYVDGVADGLPLGNLLAVPPSVAVLRVGRSVSFPTAKRFKGKLDELRIWSTPRTAQEIAALKDVSFATGVPGIVGYWSFAEGSGQQASDVSGHVAAASLGGSTAVEPEDPQWSVDVPFH